VSESPQDDRDALETLLISPGWALFVEMVRAECASQFEQQITRALDHPDTAIAIDRMRQVAAVRQTGLRWVQWPKERISTLIAQEQTATFALQPSRRPVGL
jgi:hypothetical protein